MAVIKVGVGVGAYLGEMGEAAEAYLVCLADARLRPAARRRSVPGFESGRRCGMAGLAAVREGIVYR